MKKLFPVLFAAGLTLTLSSSLMINAIGNDESDGGTTKEKLELPPNTCYVEINCDDGCLVKQGEGGSLQKNYKEYVPFKTNLPFYFSLTGQGFDYPTLVFNVDNDPAKGVSYTYDPDVGALTLIPDDCEHVVIDAYSMTPSIEIHYDEKAAGQQIAFSYTGSVKAVDFGDGRAVRPIDVRTNIIDGELFPRPDGLRVKIFGNCSSIIFDPISDLFTAAPSVREIYFNYGITSIDMMLFAQLTNVHKLYIGPDVKQITMPFDIEKALDQDILAFFDLEEVVVSEDNPYFDSRQNCGCLIDSRTNDLIIGGANGFVPDGVKTIKKAAFVGNRRLSYLRLPASVETIESFAFANSSIAYIELSANLKTIQERAFSYCNMLTTVDFSNLTHSPFMTPAAFEKAEGIFNLKNRFGEFYAPFIHKDPEVMASIYAEAEKHEWGKLPEWFATSLKYVPSAVIINELDPDLGGSEEFGAQMQYDIGNPSYYGCLFANPLDPSLEAGSEASYRASYEQDGRNRLSAYCVNVYSIYEEQTGPEKYYYEYQPLNMWFSHEEYDYEKEEFVHIPYGRNADDIAFIKYFGAYGGDYTNTDIAPYSYYGLANLKEFVFADFTEETLAPLHVIDAHAFENTGLKSITVPDSVEAIKCYAFANCPNLASISCLEALRSGELLIYGLSFTNDTSLTTVNIKEFMSFGPGPDDENYVNPFSGCTSLRSFQMTGRSKIFVDGNGILMYNDKAICAPNNVTVAQADYDSDQFYAGCFTTSCASAIGPFIDRTYQMGENFLSPYAFAYSKVKKIKFTALDRFYNYMFAECPNLEIIDLTNLEYPSGYMFENDIEPNTIMHNSNPDFKILVRKDRGSDFEDWFSRNNLFDLINHIEEAQ